MNLEAGHSAEYVGVLTGKRISVNGGRIQVCVPANSGEIWIPAELCSESFAPIKTVEIEKAPEPVNVVEAPKIKPVEQPKAEPVKVQEENTHHDSLVNWVRSFH